MKVYSVLEVRVVDVELFSSLKEAYEYVRNNSLPDQETNLERFNQVDGFETVPCTYLTLVEHFRTDCSARIVDSDDPEGDTTTIYYIKEHEL
jgi:hypothetical protein